MGVSLFGFAAFEDAQVNKDTFLNEQTKQLCVDFSCGTFDCLTLLWIRCFASLWSPIAQKNKCTCVADDLIPSHYRSLVSKFYTKHAPDKHDEFMQEKFDKFAVNTGSETQPKFRCDMNVDCIASFCDFTC
jgi:hypothetical protein